MAKSIEQKQKFIEHALMSPIRAWIYETQTSDVNIIMVKFNLSEKFAKQHLEICRRAGLIQSKKHSYEQRNNRKQNI